MMPLDPSMLYKGKTKVFKSFKALEQDKRAEQALKL